QESVDWQPEHTLAGELTSGGYQSEMIGKMHLHPRRRRFGFEHVQLADNTRGDDNDYIDWLQAQGVSPADPGVAHGVSPNGWVGRPNHLPEEHSHSFYCVDRAMRFLKRRDETAPFFLNISMVAPHPPLTPPKFYYDRYIDEELPEPLVGDWAELFDKPERGLDVNAHRMRIGEQPMRYARAAYYGMINHIDDQIGRLFTYMNSLGVLQNTFVLFTSDHGEMLGDHNMFRKTFAYEGSARVPFIARAPKDMKMQNGVVTSCPIGIQDVMPTFLDVAGLDIPDSITGSSILPLMCGEESSWRKTLHGEHSGCYDYDDGVHYITDGHMKYVWYTQSGKEHLFDLENDPNELHDISLEVGSDDRIEPWRQELIRRLQDRPEGFTDGEKLIAGRPHEIMVPGYPDHRN
ncbi:MAG: sulfatase-like hydrolase/transferase, partial [Candidatus Latescibacteria bacterium]|nr:sulfatase-like hydrolase/transferase [Candidatus Latescibacterota bacterium]